MKKKGNTSDYAKERNAELRRTFFSQLSYSTTTEALEKTIKSPSSRFWVDPDRARDVLSRIEKNPETKDTMYPQRRRMYEALYRKYQEISRRFPGQSKIESVTMAVYSAAPEFFITPSGARRILYNNA
ncbi:MAG: hypothetical protein K2L11_04160 [Muribaculaceae bacterium]|nr:hypothetical protein [Muribaculaceae bacterium]